MEVNFIILEKLKDTGGGDFRQKRISQPSYEVQEGFRKNCDTKIEN